MVSENGRFIRLFADILTLVDHCVDRSSLICTGIGLSAKLLDFCAEPFGGAWAEKDPLNQHLLFSFSNISY